MTEFELSRIIINEEKKEQLLVLKEKNGTRAFPLVVGLNEAVAIHMHLSKNLPARPLTHDLMAGVFAAFGARLDRVVIDKLIENTFHAKLWVYDCDNELKIIDARPSDGIALAVRLGAAIYVEEEVLSIVAQESR